MNQYSLSDRVETLLNLECSTWAAPVRAVVSTKKLLSFYSEVGKGAQLSTLLDFHQCRTPTWGKTKAINTAADKIANGSLPVPIKKAQ
eukprot:179627-Rhodomonas_salina.1